MKESGSNSNYRVSVGFCGLLFIVFLVLKLVKAIDWSWWWVTAPLWSPAALYLAGVVIYILVMVIVGVIKRISKD